MWFEAFRRARWAVWLPAVLIIFVQFASGVRDLPQLAFFVIYLREQHHLPPVSISTIVAGSQVVGMLTALFSGAITSRIGSKWVLACGLALSGLGSLAFQFHALWLVVILWLIAGAGLALATVGGMSCLTAISKSGGLGILAAFYALSMTAGGALGNPLAGVTIQRYGFTRFSTIAIGISIFITLVVSLFLKGMRDPAKQKDAPATGILVAARLPLVRYLVGLRSFPTIFYGVLMVLIPLLLNDLSNSKVLVATYGTTNLLVASAAQLLAGRSADRWGARIPTTAAYSLMILSGLGLAFFNRTVWGLFVFGVLGIAVAWSLSTLMMVWVNDGVEKSDQPSTFGLLHAVWSVSMITGSVIGGGLAGSLPGLPFLIAGSMNILSLLLIQRYYRKVPVYRSSLTIEQGQ